ncbi:EAL domain-containing protein [Paenibacillus sp. Marseille-Q4541]|uniref:EAL domain-containing protein n=1 Tax=Paenibacillus sp. Marseille-Q4541 TaxID=2831522 RepID=UPI002019A54E|nr:EAL domain-containing protein [Paenibacillus sp. Marseille-Q4541]
MTVIPDIIPYLLADSSIVHHTSDTLFIYESAVTSLNDFCQDHMDMDQMQFRIFKEPWRPFRDWHIPHALQWVDDIILQKKIVCYAQPIVEKHGSVIAHEMLARFVQNDGSLLSPFEVFEAAKLRGRLYALDRLCRMEAVRASAGLSGLVFINFIPTSIYSPQHCLSSTIKLAEEIGASPSKFVFEVVETEKVDDLEHLKNILGYYKERGFQYALDDVGEGYSTIELLREIRPHYMKLDKKYVQSVAKSEEKQKVAQTMLEAALQSGSIPLAEGVEEIEDFVWLRDCGFRMFQGYLFGRPAPVHSFAS